MQREVEEKRKKRDEDKKAEQSGACTEELSDVPAEETSLTQEESAELSQEADDLPVERVRSKGKAGEAAFDKKGSAAGAMEKTSTEQPVASESDREAKKYPAFYYWPILPQEHYKRWEIENATM